MSVCLFPNFIGSIFAYNSIYTEISLKLKMGPMIKRIADAVLQSLAESSELFLVGSITCHIFFIQSA